MILFNARDAKNVLSRKTHVNNAQWFQKLHPFSFLQASLNIEQEVHHVTVFDDIIFAF